MNAADDRERNEAQLRTYLTYTKFFDPVGMNTKQMKLDRASNRKGWDNHCRNRSPGIQSLILYVQPLLTNWTMTCPVCLPGTDK